MNLPPVLALSVASVAVLLCNSVSAQVYSDQTAAVGIDFTRVNEETDTMLMGGGAAWGDYDGDGDPDLYVAQRIGSNALYQNQGGTTFVDRAALYGVEDASGEGTGALFGDYDNDGDQDLYVMNRGDNIMFQNDGSDGAGGWIFTDVTAILGVEGFGRTSAAVYGDYDNDGWLDLYVANHSFDLDGIDPGDDHSDFFYHNVEGPGGARIFEDVTDLLTQDPLVATSPAHSAGFFDYDNDGDLDLYVVNEDFTGADPDVTGENMMHRNDGPDGLGGWIFTEVAAAIGLDKQDHPMGLSIGDYNNDGWWDVVMSDAGANNLWQNNAGTFLEVGNEAGVAREFVPGTTNKQFGWGLTFTDSDLDGFEDLYVATGELSFPTGQPNPLFMNNGDTPNCTFTEVTDTSGANVDTQSRCVVKADYDLDGDEDLFVVPMVGDVSLFRNEQIGGDYLGVKLNGRHSNSDGIGAIVMVTANGITQRRLLQSGSTTSGGHDKVLYFGVTGATIVDHISVEWPSGLQNSSSNQAINQVMSVSEPCGQASWQNYGEAGVAGTLGVPELSASADPELGVEFQLIIGNSLGESTPGLLFTGISSTSLPGSWGGPLVVTPILTLLTQVPATGFSLDVLFDQNLALCGSSVFVQMLQLDPGAPKGISSTEGLELALGN